MLEVATRHESAGLSLGAPRLTLSIIPVGDVETFDLDIKMLT